MAGMFDGNATVDTTGSSAPIAVSVVNGLSVSIGTVQIKDTSNVVINPATEETSVAILGALGGGVSVNVYNEALAVSSGMATTVALYTVPIGQSLVLQHVEVSGDIMATYSVLVDGSLIAKRRTYFTHYNDDFYTSKNGLSVSSNQQVVVSVTHNRTLAGNFNASIYGVLT